MSVSFFLLTAPYHTWPCGVGFVADYDMDVELAHDVADGAGVDFVSFEMLFYELGDLASDLAD